MRSVPPGGSDAELARIFSLGRSAWPDVPLTQEELRELLQERATPRPIAELPAARAAELFLCCACARGHPRALRTFDSQYLDRLDPLLRRIAGGESEAREVKQELRQLLLLGGERTPPRIAQFSGDGDLYSWLRVIAVRTALRHARSRQREQARSAPPELADRLPAPVDLDLQLSRPTYHAAFKLAFAEALAGLSPRERLLLLQSGVDGLSIDALAGLYRIDRSTAARWLARARRRLLAATQQGLAARLGIDRRDAGSVVRQLRDELGSSLVSLLREARP
jgi:RNA polymerase sigma-70 factor (ECF subfamily)